MDLTKKITQKTSGIRKNYKPGQLVTIENCVFRINGVDIVWIIYISAISN